MTRSTFQLLMLITLACGGCASAPTTGRQTEIMVRVNNNLIPPTSLSVYLMPVSGIERHLGTVIGSRSETLHYVGLPPTGEYQLVARTTGGRVIASNVLLLDDVVAIDWDLRRNFVDLTPRSQ